MRPEGPSCGLCPIAQSDHKWPIDMTGYGLSALTVTSTVLPALPLRPQAPEAMVFIMFAGGLSA